MKALFLVPKRAISTCLLAMTNSNCASSASGCGAEKGCNGKKSWALNSQVEQAINRQILAEFTVSYAYTTLGCYFDGPTVLLPGFAKLHHKLSKEERRHGLALCSLMAERGGLVKFCPVVPPEPQHWETPLEAFRSALEFEDKIFKGVTQLLEIGRELGDDYTCHFVENNLFDMKSVTKLLRLTKMLESAKTPSEVHNIDMMLRNKQD